MICSNCGAICFCNYPCDGGVLCYTCFVNRRDQLQEEQDEEGQDMNDEVLRSMIGNSE